MSSPPHEPELALTLSALSLNPPSTQEGHGHYAVHQNMSKEVALWSLKPQIQNKKQESSTEADPSTHSQFL